MLHCRVHKEFLIHFGWNVIRYTIDLQILLYVNSVLACARLELEVHEVLRVVQHHLSARQNSSIKRGVLVSSASFQDKSNRLKYEMYSWSTAPGTPGHDMQFH